MRRKWPVYEGSELGVVKYMTSMERWHSEGEMVMSRGICSHAKRWCRTCLDVAPASQSTTSKSPPMNGEMLDEVRFIGFYILHIYIYTLVRCTISGPAIAE